MTCSKCGSNNVIVKDEIYVEEKGSSIIINILLICLTAGFWAIWLLIKLISGKSKKSVAFNRKVAVCQNCGATYVLSNKRI